MAALRPVLTVGAGAGVGVGGDSSDGYKTMSNRVGVNLVLA